MNGGDLRFERSLKEYRKIVNELKRKAILKYGIKAGKWFA